jgi:hypothetical protein
MRKSPYSVTYFSFNTALSNTVGEIILSMSANTTIDIFPGRYMYDVVMISSANAKSRVVEGIVNVLPGVSR